MFNECSSLKYIKLYRITEETINFQDWFEINKYLNSLPR
jgi:hypothetical protein